MDEQTFAEPEIKKYLAEHFITIRVNSESRSEQFAYKGERYTSVQLTRHFGVRSYPSLAYLDRQGEPIAVVPGFIPPKTFLPLLHYIEKECYKQQITFEEFLKGKEDCE